MHAVVLDRPHQPLVLKSVPLPAPKPGQVLLKVQACGVCRTDLHIVDGELDRPKLPLILGHEVVGTVAQLRQRGQENLCERAQFTGAAVLEWSANP